MASFSTEQKQQIAAWLNAGAKPAEVQQRIEKEFAIRMTYMDVRFLIDDLKVMPKDPEPVVEAKPAAEAPAEVPPDAEGAFAEPLDEDPALPDTLSGGGTVTVKIDELMKPGTMVSGRATFSDGKGITWDVDQYGRMRVMPDEPGYRPSQADMQDFQITLQKKLMGAGY